MLFTAILAFSGCLVLAAAYPSYRNKVPNGALVPNPCEPKTERYWPGVGHEDISGRGDRNPFGRDFERYGKVWNQALCKLDSDGDGKTNGEELGDPDCVWNVEANLRLSSTISHPGICEPNTSKSITKEYCDAKNSWLKCQPFTCAAFDKSGVQRTELVFATEIPRDKDSYYCQGFKLPSDSNYHIIGFKPQIKNDLVHDIIVYGCQDRKEEDYQEYDRLKSCFAGLEHCTTPIGAWSSETDGQCFAEEFGLPMGRTGYKYVVVQIHWHNEDGATRQTDESGMILYYQSSHLRKHTAQVLRVGQAYINLPPGRSSVEVEGKCTRSCTELMTSSKINIASAFLRMNNFGISGGLDLLSGRKRTLLSDQKYNVNQPKLISFDDPIEFEAGDELKIQCRYNTEGQIIPVGYGESADKEMCTGFLTVYPAISNMTHCSQWKDLPYCSLNSELSYPNCDPQTFVRLLKVIGEYCNDSCDGLCLVMIRGFTHTGCYRGRLAEFIDEIYLNIPENKRIKSHIFPLIKTCLKKSSAGKAVPYINLVNLAAIQVSFFLWKRFG